MARNLLAACIVIVIALGAAALWKREELGRLMAVNSLFAEDRIVGNFSAMGELFLATGMDRGDGPVSPLPDGPDWDLPADVAAWLDERSATSLLILKDGAVVFEDYYRGTGPEDRRISWSVAKSFLSALTGILVAEGAIDLARPVTDYAPSLADSAYAGATVEDVLQMESGIEFDEDYLDFWSDINRMGRVLALGRSMDGFAVAQDRRRADPGSDWKYVSIDTHVLGMVARGATGRSVIDLLEEKIVQPLGLEADPYYVTDGDGVAFVLGGLNLRTRDYARFGQMILQDGRWQGRQVVPADWIGASTRPSALTDPGDSMEYGYQWWIDRNWGPGEFTGRGIYGQYLYINQPLGVVIVKTAADRQFREPGVSAANNAMLARIARDVAGL